MSNMSSDEESDQIEWSDHLDDFGGDMDIDDINVYPVGSDFEIVIENDIVDDAETDADDNDNGADGNGDIDDNNGNYIVDSMSEDSNDSLSENNESNGTSADDSDDDLSNVIPIIPRESIGVALDLINAASSLDSYVREELKKKKENPSTETTDNEDKIPEEPFSCPICLEGLTNNGAHKPACLKCGHIFGEKCIERWIKVGCNSEARRCPTCNTKAALKDIRVIYAKQLIAIDTTELTALEIKLNIEKIEKTKIQAEFEKYKVQNKFLYAEVDRLKNIIKNTKSGLPSTSYPTSSRQCLKKIILCKLPGCRVTAFNKSNLMLVVGQHSDSNLFVNSHVIRKLNASILEPSNECIYAHSKQIRDMAFHPNETNLLASVSLDKYVKLIDMVSNSVVSYFHAEEPLWSCCWAGDNPNILIAGSQTGSLFYIDRRFMKLLDAQRNQKFACVSLIPLSPSSSRSFINGGFIKTGMNAISVFEQSVGNYPNYKTTQLSLNGLWSSSSYDSQSNLLLSSSKPCGANKSVRHIVSKISDFSVEGPVINPVATFYGGDKATQLSRSCIVPANGLHDESLVCCYDEKSKNIKLFNVNSGNSIHNFQVQENILDLCPLNGVIMNGRRVVAGLSDSHLSIFSV